MVLLVTSWANARTWFAFKYFFASSPQLMKLKTHMDLSPGSIKRAFCASASRSPPREAHMGEAAADGSITLQEWQGWGTTSPMPAAVREIVEDMKVLAEDMDAQMTFGGNGGKLQGNLKIYEDRKHRATYQAIADSEQKLQFFSARQIACRLLGSRGYLCQKCWLPAEDCMCSKVCPCSLWHGIRFWVYMHPKDFLRQNNTGKLLWQIFGVEAASLCLFGITEHEDIMWNSFTLAGKSKVWCLYPNKNAEIISIQDAFGQESLETLDLTQGKINRENSLNFILIDGTWSNSGAMFKRLKDRANSVWGDDNLHCISLSAGASAMHKLRPQPSWDRTCTAAAAAGLISELKLLPQFCSCRLEEQGQVIEDALTALLDALTTRRLRMGRSITRKVRHATNIC